MRYLFDTATKQGLSRVEWTTDRDNIGAQRFYEQLGASEQRFKVFYRVEGEALHQGAG